MFHVVSGTGYGLRYCGFSCRRLRTGRPLVPGTTDESKPHADAVAGNPLPWLPLDERFNSVKNHGANADLAVHANLFLCLISSTACADISSKMTLHALQFHSFSMPAYCSSMFLVDLLGNTGQHAATPKGSILRAESVS